MELKGSVESIVFYNSENGYTVLELCRDTDGEIITCVGCLPSVSVGENLTLSGEMTSHSKYGEQFAVEECKINSPVSIKGIEIYLSSGLIKGVGPVTARSIVKKFKKNALNIIENEPMRLAEITGISKKKAREIGEAYKGIKDMQEQILYLQGYNMTLNLAMKIYNVYKDSTREILTENPYRLIDDVDGIGFITADKIAVSMGYQTDSDFRFRAGVVHALRDNAEKQGNTYITKENLIKCTQAVLRLPIEEITQRIDDILESLELDLDVRRININDTDCIALSSIYNTEKSIAGKLIRLMHSEIEKFDDNDIINEFEVSNHIKLHFKQRAAVLHAVNSGVSVITGGPGTGKTTIIKCICHIFNTRGMKPLCVTPTGRAAKRMQQATGEDAGTIHRALEMQYQNGMVFNRNETNPLPNKVIIVDEMSMVDAFVFNALLKAIRDGSRIILVGDKDQLPSVGAGNVLSDIISSGLIDVSYLEFIYRQNSDSLIIDNAHRINDCEMPIINNKSKDFFYMPKDTPEEIAALTTQLVTKRLPQFTHEKPVDIQVLSPMKAGQAGVENINALLQQEINPPAKNKNELKSGNTIFRLGDKVMQTTNDYQAEWVKIYNSGYIEEGQGVFNGDLGFITEIEPGASLTVTFEDNRQVSYAANDIGNLMLAYCITIHKSQGSEFNTVVIPLMSGPPTILNKNLLYTGITRAKKTVVLVGNMKHLYAMVKNNHIVTRNTLLCHFLIEEEAKYNKYINCNSSHETED